MPEDCIKTIMAGNASGEVQESSKPFLFGPGVFGDRDEVI